MTTLETYIEFLKSKISIAKESGFEIEDSEINPILLPHQKDAVKWAIRGGRRALFESFGLGKTIQQIEICRIIKKHKGGNSLIVCPLGVRQEFNDDSQFKTAKWKEHAEELGFDIEEIRKTYGITLKYIKSMSEIKDTDSGFYITNYERVRDGDIDPLKFTVVSLDEASVLRSYGSKTYQTFLSIFRGVQYKFVCTATPSPNKFKELIHYGGYLEVMDTGQALTRFFQRDSTKANNLTLYPHKEKEFWFWLSTWAIFITKPSDMGYSDEGYEMPEMQLFEHMVKVDHSQAGADRDGQIKMFRDASLGLKDAAREKRESIDMRIEAMENIIKQDPDSHYIIWHDLENERHAIMQSFKRTGIEGATEVYGTQDLDEREQRTLDFKEGRVKYLATKPEISGSGPNFQYHCHKAIFLGIGYKFNDFIQAIHRILRYMQQYQVEIHIIFTESEIEILKSLYTKWEQHKYLVKQMTIIMKEHGLTSMNVNEKLMRTIGCERKEIEGKCWKAVNNDNVPELMSMPENSVDLFHTSIPFGNQYEYTPSYNDFGHNEDNEAFFAQMDFLVPEMLRTLKPGRIAAIHVKDRIRFGNVTGLGMPTVDPFSDMTVASFRKHGFAFTGRITIVTDVVRENNQTYRLGWTENSKDGSKMGCGMSEYVLLFRKLPTDLSTAYADEPVMKSKTDYTRAKWQIDAHGFWRSSGDRFMTPEEIMQLPIDKIQTFFKRYISENIYDYHKHVEIGETMESVNRLPATFMSIAPTSPAENTWTDVNRMLTLNGKQSQKKLQMHVCPLQFDIVERIITRFSNPGDTVCDPFAGLSTVPYMAVKLGRKGLGIELNPDYFRDGILYMKDMEIKMNSATLFDVEELNKAI